MLSCCHVISQQCMLIIARLNNYLISMLKYSNDQTYNLQIYWQSESVYFHYKRNYGLGKGNRVASDSNCSCSPFIGSSPAIDILSSPGSYKSSNASDPYTKRFYSVYSITESSFVQRMHNFVLIFWNRATFETHNHCYGKCNR